MKWISRWLSSTKFDSDVFFLPMAMFSCLDLFSGALDEGLQRKFQIQEELELQKLNADKENEQTCSQNYD